MTLILTTSLNTSSIIQERHAPSIVMQSRAATTKQASMVSRLRIGTIAGDYDILKTNFKYSLTSGTRQQGLGAAIKLS